MYFAHSTGRQDRADWQPLIHHLMGVAGLASARGDKFGARLLAGLIGLLHDLGKYTPAFDRRLTGGPSVDHATAGAQEVLRLAGIHPVAAELAAYAIAGHHAGLPDRRVGETSLAARLGRSVEPLDPVWRDEIRPEVAHLFPPLCPHADPKRRPFQAAFLGRMLFSCLIDADRRDTEDFYVRTEGLVADREWPALQAILGRLIAAFDAYMAGKRSDDGAVNRLRGKILDHVRARAEAPTGVFTLTVPTGGGKTLASLAFALDHARRHGLERIVYAIPFTSVIDQTAAIFREVLGDDVVLEHHSAIDEETISRAEQKDKLRLAMEDWAAPVVVTTNVQLFESLFSHRPSRCRKLHNLARAVIVLDEAQTIPRPLLRPCVAALDELARNYGASIVLCTATQPALRLTDGFAGGLEIDDTRELAPDPDGLAAALKRVEIQRRETPMSDDDLVAALGGTPQGLVIVNSRAHALALYRTAKGAGLDGVLHLTTRQYAEHRRRILAAVRERLKAGEPCRLIATSLVEAGVDLDFPKVWRAEAGLEQILQAAGRANREGRRPVAESIVTVFKPVEAQPPRELRQLAADFARIAPKYPDLHALAAIRAYFGEVYWRTGDEGLDRIRVPGPDGETVHSVLDLLTMSRTETDFAYRTIGENFRLIESGMVPVIVAREEAARRALDELKAPHGHAGKAARKLQPFTVQVPPQARARLLACGHLSFVAAERFGDQFAVVADSLYEDDVGLKWDEGGLLGLADAII